MKIKPPRQAQEWSYSSYRESIGMALSSPGIRANKKTHINCGPPARMAGNVDQIRRQGRWNNTTINISHQPSKRIGAINGRLPHIWKTFIQDSVLRMELHPCYPIWQHSIFSDPAYLSFKRDMLQIEAQEHDPAHTLLQQCVPYAL
ncbi:hypothetical protein [Absidia glauca]|uniref:Ndc10 domain-containing protein n=1 Tax=Absidia glauca TaxID=4829 RepID=A0A163JBA0_ABSGL|nr:hypothetical protein [Absidia glauca]